MSVSARVLGAAFALALAGAACGGAPATGEGATPPSSASAPTGTVTMGPAAAVPDVLDFEAPLLGGGTLRGADLAGKDVAFWFWAPW